MARLEVLTAPVKDPVLLEDVKEQARVIGTTDDAYLRRLIAAATEDAQDFTNRSFITQTLRLTLDGFPGRRVLYLERPPVQSVTSVKYLDDGGTQQTLSSALYTEDLRSSPARIVLNESQRWPITDNAPNTVEVEYVAGYGLDPKTVPDLIRHAITILITHWYDHRGMVEAMPGLLQVDTPKAYNSLLHNYKVFQF